MEKELNLVSWNDGAPKYDIREWALANVTAWKKCYTDSGRVRGPYGRQHGQYSGEETDLILWLSLFNKYLPLIIQ